MPFLFQKDNMKQSITFIVVAIHAQVTTAYLGGGRSGAEELLPSPHGLVHAFTNMEQVREAEPTDELLQTGMDTNLTRTLWDLLAFMGWTWTRLGNVILAFCVGSSESLVVGTTCLF